MSKIVKSLYRRPSQGLISGDEREAITDVRNFRLLDGAWQKTEHFFAFYQDGKATRHKDEVPQIARVTVNNSVVTVWSAGDFDSTKYECAVVDSDGLQVASATFNNRQAMFYPLDLGNAYGTSVEFVIKRSFDNVVVGKVPYYLPELFFVPIPVWERNGSVLEITPRFSYDVISVLMWDGVSFVDVVSFPTPVVDLTFTFDLASLNLPFLSWRVQGSKMGVQSLIDPHLADSLISGEDSLVLEEPSEVLSADVSISTNNGLFVSNESNQIQWYRMWTYPLGYAFLQNGAGEYSEQPIGPGQSLQLLSIEPGQCFQYLAVLKNPYDGSNMSVGVPSDLVFNERAVTDLPDTVSIDNVEIATNGGNFDVLVVGSGMTGAFIYSDSNEHQGNFDTFFPGSPELASFSFPKNEVELEDYSVNLWYVLDEVFYLLARYWKNTGWEVFV